MIRNTTKIGIIKTIDKHKYLSSTDFRITYDENKVCINYEHNDKFYFEITLPSRTTSKTIRKTQPPALMRASYDTEKEIEIYIIEGKVCPGEMVLNEYIEIEGKDNITNRITTWLDSLWSEVISEPTSRLIDEQNKIIDDLKSKTDHISEDYFSKEEGEALKEKLDILEQSLKSQIEEKSKENENINNLVSELEEEIETLKTIIYLYNKKSWFKSSIGRLYKWISKENNRKLLKDGVKLLKPILPDSVKDIVDD